MSYPVSTDPDGLRATAGRFVEGYNKCVGIKNRLQTSLEGLQWKADSKNQFEQTMQQWGQKYDEILKHLDAMADMLISTGGHQEQAEDFAIQQGKSFFK